MLKLICAIKCSNNHKHPQIHSQDSLYFTIILAVLRGAALSHLKRGTRKLAPTLTFLDGSRRIKWSRPTPWVRDPSCSTPRPRDSSRPTLGAGSVSPDPKVTRSILPDPKVARSVSSNLESTSFVSPDPLGAVTVVG